MKFKSENGIVFDYINEAWAEFCRGRDCDKCPLTYMRGDDVCSSFIARDPAFAARVMGFAVIEESPDPPQKPMSQWTLGEVQEFCECSEAAGRCGVYCEMISGGHCRFDGHSPADWNLRDLPRWTEKDIEDAKATLLVYELPWVARDETGELWAYEVDPPWLANRFLNGGGECFWIQNSALIPSLRTGEKALLSEIVGGAK